MAAQPLADRRKWAFNEDAERYDRTRPRYPDALFADLQQLAAITPSSRLLEIGAGTGQATLPLARLGCEIVALDLGPDMVEVARRNLADFPKVDVIAAAFEDYPLPETPFDAIISATAWHWLKPEVRLVKSAQALRRDGSLAIVSTHHVTGGTAEFFVASQKCYLRWDPEARPGHRLPAASEVPVGGEEIEQSPDFSSPVVRRYEWEQAYSSSEYVDLMLTWSGVRAMDTTNREGLLDCIAMLIDTRYGGRIIKPYMTQLLLGGTDLRRSVDRYG